MLADALDALTAELQHTACQPRDNILFSETFEKEYNSSTR